MKFNNLDNQTINKSKFLINPLSLLVWLIISQMVVTNSTDGINDVNLQNTNPSPEINSKYQRFREIYMNNSNQHNDSNQTTENNIGTTRTKINELNVESDPLRPLTIDLEFQPDVIESDSNLNTDEEDDEEDENQEETNQPDQTQQIKVTRTNSNPTDEDKHPTSTPPSNEMRGRKSRSAPPQDSFPPPPSYQPQSPTLSIYHPSKYPSVGLTSPNPSLSPYYPTPSSNLPSNPTIPLTRWSTFLNYPPPALLHRLQPILTYLTQSHSLLPPDYTSSSTFPPTSISPSSSLTSSNPDLLLRPHQLILLRRKSRSKKGKVGWIDSIVNQNYVKVITWDNKRKVNLRQILPVSLIYKVIE